MPTSSTGRYVSYTEPIVSRFLIACDLEGACWGQHETHTSKWSSRQKRRNIDNETLSIIRRARKMGLLSPNGAHCRAILSNVLPVTAVEFLNRNALPIALARSNWYVSELGRSGRISATLGRYAESVSRRGVGDGGILRFALRTADGDPHGFMVSIECFKGFHLRGYVISPY